MEIPYEVLKIPQPGDLVEIRLQELFFQWMAMGEGRSFKAIADIANMQVWEVVAHAKLFKWRACLGLLSFHASQETMDRMAQTMADVNEVHVKELRDLRERALVHLKTATLSQDRDAIKLYTECVKMERQILGIDADSDTKDLAELLAEKLKTVQARVLPDQEESKQIPEHEFDLEENIDIEELDVSDG